GARVETGEPPDQRPDGPARHALRLQEDLGAARVAEPGDPALLSGEDREEEEELAVEVLAVRRDPLARGGDSRHVAEVGDPVQAGGQRPDVVLDRLTSEICDL